MNDIQKSKKFQFLEFLVKMYPKSPSVQAAPLLKKGNVEMNIWQAMPGFLFNLDLI